MARSDAVKAAALTRLAANGGNIELTAKQIGVTSKTLRRWSAGENVTKKSVGDAIEQTIIALFEHMPKQMSGRDWGIAIGILLDKWLVMKGEPTSRIESIVKRLEEMPQGERESILSKAEAILAGTEGGSASAGRGASDHDA